MHYECFATSAPGTKNAPRDLIVYHKKSNLSAFSANSFFLRVALTGTRSEVICLITFLVPFGILFAKALHLHLSAFSANSFVNESHLFTLGRIIAKT